MNCLMIAALLLGAECHSDCTFVRGDANCSGTVNLTDFVAIAQGTYKNADAADCNDSGHADISDAAYLTNFLFQSGPPPKCPFPSPGRDCTADGLETCCSRPQAGGFDDVTVLTPVTCDGGRGSSTGWDHDVVEDFNPPTGACSSKMTVFNDWQCARNSCTTTFDVDASVFDNVYFTKRRLESGVQQAFAVVDLSTTFKFTEACPDTPPCDGINRYLVGEFPTTVKVTARAVDGGDPQPVEASAPVWTQLYYKRVSLPPNQACGILPLGPMTAVAQGVVGISSQLAGLPSDPCEEWRIESVSVDELELTWRRGTGEDDVMRGERVEVTASPYARYEWCECH